MLIHHPLASLYPVLPHPDQISFFFLNRRKPSLNTVMENAGRPALCDAMMNVVAMSVWARSLEYALRKTGI